MVTLFSFYPTPQPPIRETKFKSSTVLTVAVRDGGMTLENI